jgi:hypothetical protein
LILIWFGSSVIVSTSPHLKVGACKSSAKGRGFKKP